MKIHVLSVLVDDQLKAKAFYTDVLGWLPKHEIPLGADYWLTVVSPEAPDGPEVLLEPAKHPAAQTYRAALVADGIPAASFAVADCEATHARLVAKGVRFVQPPVDHGPVTTAVFDDTCGNLIQILQQ